MGGPRRYAKSVDGYDVPTGGRRHDLDDAVQMIIDAGKAGIYSADGTYRGPAGDKLLAPMLQGPDRVRRGERVDGQDTLLAVDVGETFEDIQDRLYRSRHYASPRMVRRARIADVLYAGIGAGLLEPVPAARVEQTVDLVLQAIADGHLQGRDLAAHGQGLRAWLGLPAGEWTDAADDAAERGRAQCQGTEPPAKREDYDENRWAL